MTDDNDSNDRPLRDYAMTVTYIVRAPDAQGAMEEWAKALSFEIGPERLTIMPNMGL